MLRTTLHRSTRGDARRPGRVVLTLLVSSGVVAGATALGVSMSGVSYASWVAQSQVQPTTITTGDAALTATQTFTPAAWSSLLPGESVRQSFMLKNNGTTPLALSAAATSTSADYEVRIAPGACGTSALDGGSLTTAAASLGALAAGASAAECFEVRLATTATPATTTSIAATITGQQATS